MDETKNPTTKSFVEELDEAVQKVKRNPKFMLEYVLMQLAIDKVPEEEISQMWANGSMIRLIAKGTHLPEDEVAKILADDMPNDSEV